MRATGKPRSSATRTPASPSQRAMPPLVVSLRPVGDHAAMRRAAAAHGLSVVALSPWRIVHCDDPTTRRALKAALGADVVIATSPTAVRAANALQALRPRRGQVWCAIGDGTAAALRRAGVATVWVPTRMDSEGVLALPVLREVQDRSVGLLTAPGGRNRLAPALHARGADVRRADIYARVPYTPSGRGLAVLRRCRAPLWLPVSSGEALQRILATVPTDIATRLRAATVLAASERIANIAHDCGCQHVRIAPGPRPSQLLAAGIGARRG